MDFNQILQWLQSMIGNQQTQNTNQYGSALGLGQQELGQQGTEFGQNLALQQQTQNQNNALAQAQLAQQGSEFQQNLAPQIQQQQWGQGQQAPINAANTQAANYRNAEIQALMNSPWMSNPNSAPGQSLLQQLSMLTGGNYGNTSGAAVATH